MVPARVLGTTKGGGKAEALILGPAPESPGAYRAIVRPGRRLRPGAAFDVADGLSLTIEDLSPDGVRIVRFAGPGATADPLDRIGHVPLPPYIDRADEPLDRERYQTVYAREPGSIAAPTAGLHFTPMLLAALETKGVRRADVVLHVGLGTFAKVEAENIEDHAVAPEEVSVPDETAALHASTRAAGGRVIAVGTTTVRALESSIEEHGTLAPGTRRTSLVIRPGHRFRAVDGLITNFHMPRSSLLFLVCAFGGTPAVMAAYRNAVTAGYRFFSYGDAMFLTPPNGPGN